MTQSTHLGLPYLDPAQAQKHVTHNEALALIDALTQLSVSMRDVTTPPATPSEGDRVLVGAGPTGLFAGKASQIATFLAGDWTLLAPQPGWRAYVEAEDLVLYYDGEQWRDLVLSLRSLQNLSLLGVGATADASNPLSVKLNATLFAAKGVAEGGSGDLRFTLNKESATKTVSQLYQSGWSGRAETGLTGDDDFRVKVSPDGAAWKDALVVDKTSGLVTMAFTAGAANGLATLDATGKVPTAQLPTASGATVIAFTSSGTYTPSPGIKCVDVILFGGGGGGGGGARGAAGAAISGGGGGGAGARVIGQFTAAQVGASQSVTIGAGGLPGVAQTTDMSVGNAGDQGGSTVFGLTLRASGGGGGAGGGIGVGSGGGAGGAPGSASSPSGSGATGGAGAFGSAGGGGSAGAAPSVLYGSPAGAFGSGGGGSPANGGAGTGGGASFDAPTGGGSGGGITSANVVSAGGNSGGAFFNGPITAPGGAAGLSGAAGASRASIGPLNRGATGGGGGGSHATTPGAGGAGGFPGGGGGGGGASQNGANSGGGGEGAAGYAIIIEHF